MPTHDNDNSNCLFVMRSNRWYDRRSSSEIDTGAQTKHIGRPRMTRPLESRRVHFKDDVLVIETFNLDDISITDAAAYWYSKKESRALKSSRDDCARGLEYKHPVESKRRHSNKKIGRNAVLFEQDRQRHRGIEEDDELLASIYALATAHCRRKALVVGLKDEHEVYGIIKGVVFSNEEEHRARPLIAPQKGVRSLFGETTTENCCR